MLFVKPSRGKQSVNEDFYLDGFRLDISEESQIVVTMGGLELGNY